MVGPKGYCGDWGQLPSEAASIAIIRPGQTITEADSWAGRCFSEALSLKLRKGGTKSEINSSDEHRSKGFI